MTNRNINNESTLETIAQSMGNVATTKLLTQVFLAKEPSKELQALFSGMENPKQRINLALFYKAALKLSLSAYGEMLKYDGNGHLKDNATFKDTVALVVLAVCSGIGKEELAPILMNSGTDKRMEYLNNLWGNYEVIVSYVNQMLNTDLGYQFEKAALQLAA